jgi:hypothetical protein
MGLKYIICKNIVSIIEIEQKWHFLYKNWHLLKKCTSSGMAIDRIKSLAANGMPQEVVTR